MRFPDFPPCTSSDMVAVDFCCLGKAGHGAEGISLRVSDNLFDATGDILPLPLTVLREVA